jgi:predicted small lipoprotein YifL
LPGERRADLYGQERIGLRSSSGMKTLLSLTLPIALLTLAGCQTTTPASHPTAEQRPPDTRLNTTFAFGGTADDTRRQMPSPPPSEDYPTREDAAGQFHIFWSGTPADVRR